MQGIKSGDIPARELDIGQLQSVQQLGQPAGSRSVVHKPRSGASKDKGDITGRHQEHQKIHWSKKLWLAVQVSMLLDRFEVREMADGRPRE